MTEQEVCNEFGDTRAKGLDTDPVEMEEANDLARGPISSISEKMGLGEK